LKTKKLKGKKITVSAFAGLRFSIMLIYMIALRIRKKIS